MMHTLGVWPLRVWFVRSSLIAAWIVGGAIALLAARWEEPRQVAAEPPIPCGGSTSTPVVEGEEPDDEQMDTLQLGVTEANPSCAYYSVFDLGDVELPHGADTATFNREFDIGDGCHWRSEEQLDRLPDGRYRYHYTERPLTCRAGANPAAPCTRSGFASVQPDE
jgi:hypothetical protein